MRRILLLLFCLLSTLPGFAQSLAKTFTLNAANQNACIGTNNLPTVGIDISGTASLTLQPQVSINGSTPKNSGVTSTVAGSAAQATIVTSGSTSASYVAPVGGFDTFCLNVSSYSSGSLTVKLNPSAALNASLLGGSGGGSLPPGSVVNGIVQSGLIAQYAFTDNSGTTLTDSSGHLNNGALCPSTAAPTWIGAPTGGLTFNSANSQCVTLPAGLNSAGTIQIFANIQPQRLTGTPVYSCLVAGNGTKANTNAFCTNDNGSAPAGLNATNTYYPTIIENWKGALGSTTSSISEDVGSNLYTWVLDATTDVLYNNGIAMDLGSATGSAGNQTAGVYQFGGVPSGYINGNTSFWSGNIYYALFYSSELTAAQVAQNAIAVNQLMQNRGLTFVNGFNPASPTNVLVVDGDSLPGANNGWFSAAFPTIADGAWQAFYTGKSGWGVANLIASNRGAIRDEPWCPNLAGSGQCILDTQIGTNDIPATLTTFLPEYATFLAQRRAGGKYSQIWINTLPDVTGKDAGKNAVNTALLQSWQTLGGTGIVPVGEDPNLGCDGCAAGVYFTAGLHPSILGQYEIAHIIQPILNRATSGNFNFSSANTYTTGAAAGTTITVATESTNTVTLTFVSTPASFVKGADLTIAGMTPSGYDTSASNVCHILTSTSTTVTCLNSATGLGPGTLFGTAATPEQLDQDAAVILAGSATSPSFTLEPCASWVGGQNMQGWDGRVRLKNENTSSAWVVTPFASETIDGASSLTMPSASSGDYPVVILEAQASAPSTGGCNWVRIQ